MRNFGLRTTFDPEWNLALMTTISEIKLLPATYAQNVHSLNMLEHLSHQSLSFLQHWVLERGVLSELLSL